jgi:DNA-binding response OmpR family regulator
MPRRVVVASNRAGQLRLIQSALEVAGFSVIPAEDGVECLLRAEAERPELIIVEANMPVMDGMQVLAAIRARATTADIPVILLTAGISFDESAAELRHGKELYLAKPLRLSALVGAARSILAEAEASPRSEIADFLVPDDGHRVGAGR